MTTISSLSTSKAQPNFSFTNYQKFVISLLFFLQFTVVLDFTIMSPLGAIMMPALQINATQFGIVVSAYAFSAGLSGLLAAGFADRYDRKKILLFFYFGFILGTLLCGLASNYYFLLVARIITGFFGGVMSSVVMAIAADLFALELRGRVIGYLQTAFAASQILGIPAGLFFSNLWGWHIPFMLLVALSLLASVLIILYLKPVNTHLAHKSESKHHALQHLWQTLKNSEYRIAFATMALMSIGGFMLMPFGSAFTVNNLGIEYSKLSLIYLVTGITTMITGPLIGRASDSFGKLQVFIFGALLSTFMVVIYTNLKITPLPIVMLVNVILYISIFSRIIPAQALMTSVPHPSNRGAFMAVMSSLQQISGGVASVIAGLIVTENSIGKLDHFDRLGYILSCTILISMYMMYNVNKQIEIKKVKF